MTEPDVNPMRDRSPETGYKPAARAHPTHHEGTLTQVIELQTARIPSAVFLVGAAAAMVASVTFELTGNTRASRFVGMWAPTLLIAGVYNKIVKTLGTS